MRVKDKILADFKTQLETTDFGNEEKEDDSYQYILSQLDINYRNKDKLDGSLTLRDIVTIINIMDNLDLTLKECYENVVEYLEI